MVSITPTSTATVWSTGPAYWGQYTLHLTPHTSHLTLQLCYHYRGGTPHTYCGLTDHDVCCFVPDNASPVGILPTPNRVQCGRKGLDSGKEGEAEFSEWPWHVGTFSLLIFSLLILLL